MPRLILTILLLTATASPAASAIVSLSESGEEPIIRILRVNGTVTAPRAAMLSSSVAGLIERFDVDAGSRVQRGDTLVQLDDELAELSVAQARAAEAQARAALADARRRLAEAERLAPERSIAETEILSRRAEVTMDEAALSAAEATARREAALLRRHSVLAPFAGVVSRREAEVGEWVATGDPLLELVAVDGLRFDFRVPQESFPDIAMQTPVRLSLDALPEERFDGRIQAIVPVSDPNARTFLLRVLPQNPERIEFTPGMSARASVLIDTGRVAVTVPRDAIIRYPDGRTTVWLAESDGDSTSVHERQVETGLVFEEKVEIRNGLEAGERVVTRGNEALRDGQTVTLR